RDPRGVACHEFHMPADSNPPRPVTGEDELGVAAGVVDLALDELGDLADVLGSDESDLLRLSDGALVGHERGRGHGSVSFSVVAVVFRGARPAISNSVTSSAVRCLSNAAPALHRNGLLSAWSPSRKLVGAVMGCSLLAGCRTRVPGGARVHCRGSCGWGRGGWGR